MTDKQLPVTGDHPAAKMQPVALDNNVWKVPKVPDVPPRQEFSPLLTGLDAIRRASGGEVVAPPAYKPSAVEHAKYIAAHPGMVIATDAQVMAWIKGNPQLGMKFDGGKSRWSLLLRGCIKGLRGILAILEFGAQKYAADSWKEVEPQRYMEALSRHFMDIQEHGLQHIDSDSKLLSIYHLGCDALFLAHFATVEGERQAREATR